MRLDKIRNESRGIIFENFKYQPDNTNKGKMTHGSSPRGAPGVGLEEFFLSTLRIGFIEIDVAVLMCGWLYLCMKNMFLCVPGIIECECMYVCVDGCVCVCVC